MFRQVIAHTQTISRSQTTITMNQITTVLNLIIASRLKTKSDAFHSKNFRACRHSFCCHPTACNGVCLTEFIQTDNEAIFFDSFRKPVTTFKCRTEWWAMTVNVRQNPARLARIRKANIAARNRLAL